MLVRLCLLACFTFFMAVPAMAQNDPPPEMMTGDGPHGPEVVLGPPEGVEPPEDMPPMPEDPEAAHEMGIEIFFGVMSGDDGMVDLDEFKAWVRHFHMPPPDMMDPNMDPNMDRNMDPNMGGLHADDPEFADLPSPPACSADLQATEMGPQDEGVPCGEGEGNLIFRTICNGDDMAGFSMAAITLPEDRGAGCFGIEALSGHIDFQIMSAMDGSLVWDTSMGKDAYQNLHLEGGPGAVYHVQATGGSPDGSVTVSFIDVNTTGMME
jgi:hypothetical protein